MAGDICGEVRAREYVSMASLNALLCICACAWSLRSCNAPISSLRDSIKALSGTANTLNMLPPFWFSTATSFPAPSTAFSFKSPSKASRFLPHCR